MKINGKNHIAIISADQNLTAKLDQILSSTYDVTVYPSADEFLNFIKSFIDFPFDSVVCDHRIGEINGLDMIVNAHSNGYYFPFIMFSNYLDKKSVIDAVNIGAYRFADRNDSINRIKDDIEAVIIENSYRKIRKDIRATTNQLSELFENIIVLLEKYAPAEEMNKLLIEISPDGKVVRQMTAKTFFYLVEKKLKRLSDEEEFLEIIKENLYKKSA